MDTPISDPEEPFLLPDRQQFMLVEAIFSDDDRFEANYAAWLASVDIEALDPGSARLLPLLFERITASKIDPGGLAHFRSIKRHSWAKNQRLTHFANGAANALRGEGIDAIALKGIALANCHYANPGLRPMDDIDLLVRRSQLKSAGEILSRCGWREALPHVRSEFGLNILPGVNFTNEADPTLALDLHHRIFKYRFCEEATENLWKNARALPGTTMLMPCASDMLLHGCAHGASYNPMPPVRWLADGMMILRREPIDWAYFTRQCAAWRVSYPVARCLKLLVSIGDQHIPGDVIEELKAHKTDAAYRRLHRIEQVPRRPLDFADFLFLHRHTVGNTNLSALGRPRYLKYILWRCGWNGPKGVVQAAGRVIQSLVRSAAAKARAVFGQSGSVRKGIK